MNGSGLNVQSHGSVSVVTFPDVLDVECVQHLSPQLYALVEQPPTPHLLLDFRNVRFLSSRALGVLLTLRRKADPSGVQVAFSAMRPELLRVFQLTKLDALFRFFGSQDEALAAWGTPPTRA